MTGERGHGRPDTELAGLIQDLNRIERRLATLERPTGTEINQSVQKLQEAQAKLEEQQATLSSQQATLSDQQATLSSQVQFLQTQSVSDSRGNTSSYTGPNSGTNWEGYDGTYDPAITVTTGESGKLNILGSGLVATGDLGGALGVEIVGVSGPTWPGPLAGYVLGATAPGTFASVVALSPNTTYTVRMRRGRSEDVTGVVLWGYLSLTVTKLG